MTSSCVWWDKINFLCLSMLRLCVVSSGQRRCFLHTLSLQSGALRLWKNKKKKEVKYSYHFSFVGPPLCFCFCLTIFDHAAVLITLGLGVELVAVGLAEALFVGHTQAGDRVKGPEWRLACAGFGQHGQTAHSCGEKTDVIIFKTVTGFLSFSPATPLQRDRKFCLMWSAALFTIPLLEKVLHWHSVSEKNHLPTTQRPSGLSRDRQVTCPKFWVLSPVSRLWEKKIIELTCISTEFTLKMKPIWS